MCFIVDVAYWCLMLPKAFLEVFQRYNTGGRLKRSLFLNNLKISVVAVQVKHRILILLSNLLDCTVIVE